MKWLKQFGSFWYDFIVGDDWRIAVGVVGAVAIVYLAAHRGFNGWWILPFAVALLLSFSVVRVMRDRASESQSDKGRAARVSAPVARF